LYAATTPRLPVGLPLLLQGLCPRTPAAAGRGSFSLKRKRGGIGLRRLYAATTPWLPVGLPPRLPPPCLAEFRRRLRFRWRENIGD